MEPTRLRIWIGDRIAREVDRAALASTQGSPAQRHADMPMPTLHDLNAWPHGIRAKENG
jgi:hypothetical protein